MQDENAPVVFAVMGGSVEVVDYIICKGELPENEVCTLLTKAMYAVTKAMYAVTKAMYAVTKTMYAVTTGLAPWAWFLIESFNTGSVRI